MAKEPSLEDRVNALGLQDPQAAHAIFMALHDPSIGHVKAQQMIKKYGIKAGETSIRRYRTKNSITAEGNVNPKAVAETPEAVAPSEAELHARIADLEADNRRLFGQFQKAKARGEEMISAVYRAAKDASQYVGTTPVIPPSADTRNKGAEVALWHLTDWQGGKRTSSYDRKVMRKRVESFVDKAYDITQVQRADHPVKDATILVTGDMVEGVSIFAGQVWELDGELFTQMFDVADLLRWTIQGALGMYENVQVVCEWGNHGRLGKKGDGIKASDNVDRMVYQIVKDSLAHEDRITNFQVSDDWYQNFSIGNYKAMAIHGDEIKSFGGNVPAYGILRKANAWATGVLPQFTDLYLGHYHQAMQLQLANGGSVFMTGSPESDNVYAAEFVAATGRPSQRINFIDPRKGRVTAEYRVWLD